MCVCSGVWSKYKQMLLFFHLLLFFFITRKAKDANLFLSIYRVIFLRLIFFYISYIFFLVLFSVLPSLFFFFLGITILKIQSTTTISHEEVTIFTNRSNNFLLLLPCFKTLLTSFFLNTHFFCKNTINLAEPQIFLTSNQGVGQNRFTGLRDKIVKFVRVIGICLKKYGITGLISATGSGFA